MRKRTFWVAAILLASAACSEGFAPSSSAASAPTGTLVARDAKGATGSFRLGELQRLFLDSTYTGSPGPHTMRVDVIAPGGDTFGILPFELTAGADGKGAAGQRLEVRGTRIHLYHMVGTWRFVLMVDGAALASASANVVD
jgi:hypothetical protein